MAKISTYPFDNRIASDDTLVGTDSSSKQTRQFTISSIADFIIGTKNVITGSGTPGIIPVFGPTAYTIGDSKITQDLFAPNTIRIGANVNIANDLTVVGSSTFQDYIKLDADLKDSTNASGTAGQVLTSTGAGGVLWSTDGGGTVTGTGTTDYVVKFTDGPNGVIGDSTIVDNPGETSFLQDVLFNNAFQADGGGAIDGALNMLSGGPINFTDPVGPPTGKDVSLGFNANEFRIQRTDLGRYSLNIDGSATIKAETLAAGIATDYRFGTGGTFSSVNGGFTGWEFRAGGDNGYYSNSFIFKGKLGVGRTTLGNTATLDVGNASDTRPAAVFRNGVMISNNPGGISVDNTSMVIGAGNNDIVSGSDNCLAVGNGNQIVNNSDHSVVFGLGNTVRNTASASLVVGQGNTLDGTGLGAGVTARSYILGLNNSLTGSFASFVAGGSNVITTEQNAMVLGFNNNANGVDNVYAIGESNTLNDATANGVFMIGNGITGSDGNMVLGFRNDTSGYPTPDYANGLGNTKLVLSVGTVNNTNAIVITEGGVTRGGGVTQVPRILMPSILSFDYADDAAAALAGIPIGGIYHNAGALRIRRT